jgi:hypothetical protein
MSLLTEKLHERLVMQAKFRTVFDTKDGKEVLSHLMKMSGILKPQITADPSMALVRQGQQHIVLSILRVLGKDPMEITEQIKESMKYD